MKLPSKSGGGSLQKYSFGNVSLIGSGTIDVGSVLPDVYHDLTTDNFVYACTYMYSGVVLAISGGGSYGKSASLSLNLSYDASTGILSWSGSGNIYIRCNQKDHNAALQSTSGVLYCYYSA